MGSKKELKYTLETDVRYIKGVGPKRAGLLRRLRINTIEDLFYLAPRRYEDRRNIIPIKDIKPEIYATVRGFVSLKGARKIFGKNGSAIVIEDGTGWIEICWTIPEIVKQFSLGDEVIVTGKVTLDKLYNKPIFVHPEYAIIGKKGKKELVAGSIVPIYPQTEGLDTRFLRRIIHEAIEEPSIHIPETLPEAIREKYKLYSRATAIKKLHFPDNLDEAKRARDTLAFEELFYFFLTLGKQRKEITGKSVPLFKKGILTEHFLRTLPFDLTSSQKKVIKEIEYDMAREEPMQRLLQGDVGSGKTVIAVYAMLLAVENGFQAALMAPTETLAEQHYIVISDVLSSLSVSVGLLVGGMKKSEKESIANAICSGEMQIIIGTHALIQESVKFKNLAFAVVDEQHRFGVIQRSKLMAKGNNLTPHFLVMTATPIPRTLALTLYGDLDLSILDEKPAGRQPVVTAVRKGSKRDIIYNWVFDQVKKGDQAYVIAPLIEKSEKIEVKACEEVYEYLLSRAPKDLNIAMLHGRMPREERRSIMQNFRKGEIHILVSTTVIEVGIDVPNATIMVIEHAERFGLAQLHQLRGRIGRGSKKSYCILITSDKLTEDAKQRLNAMVKSNDGFYLSEVDLRLRGPGEFMGTRQHGLPQFKIADILRDQQLIEKARSEAFYILENHPEFLNIPEVSAHIKKIKKEDIIYVG